MNEFRKACYKEAQDLRAEGKPVPKRCSYHWPGYLMQVTSLPFLSAFPGGLSS